MTTLEARVAQAQPTADPAKASDPTPSPAIEPGKVSTISDYQAAKAALLAQPPPPAAPSVPDDLEAQIQRDEFGDQIHDPDADAGVSAAPAKAQEPAAKPVEQDPDRLLPHRIPTKQFSREEQEAMALKHLLETENPGKTFSLKECLDRVDAKYGKAPAAAPAAHPDPNALDPNLPQSIADLEKAKRENAKAIREKRAEIAKAESELRYDDKLALIEDLNSLETKIEALEDYAPRLANHEAARQQQFTQAYTESAGQAVELYPDAQVKGSAFYNRMAEIDRLFQETGDARFNSENKPLVIAQMVAQEQNVAPKGKGVAKATPSAPQPPVISTAGNLPVHLAPPVASGSARTTTPQVTNVDAAIAAVRNPEQLEELKQQLRERRAA